MGWEQRENLDRVSERIRPAIFKFLRWVMRSADHFFYAEDLRRFVRRETGIIAPASADRVLRDMRQRGLIDYRVVNRRESLYEALRVPEPAEEIGVLVEVG